MSTKHCLSRRGLIRAMASGAAVAGLGCKSDAENDSLSLLTWGNYLAPVVVEGHGRTRGGLEPGDPTGEPQPSGLLMIRQSTKPIVSPPESYHNYPGFPSAISLWSPRHDRAGIVLIPQEWPPRSTLVQHPLTKSV